MLFNLLVINCVIIQEIKAFTPRITYTSTHNTFIHWLLGKEHSNDQDIDFLVTIQSFHNPKMVAGHAPKSSYIILVPFVKQIAVIHIQNSFISMYLTTTPTSKQQLTRKLLLHTSAKIQQSHISSTPLYRCISQERPHQYVIIPPELRSKQLPRDLPSVSLFSQQLYQRLLRVPSFSKCPSLSSFTKIHVGTAEAQKRIVTLEIGLFYTT